MPESETELRKFVELFEEFIAAKVKTVTQPMADETELELGRVREELIKFIAAE